MSDSNDNDNNLDEVLFWAYILYRRYKHKAEQNLNDSDSYAQINSSNLLPSLSKRKIHYVLFRIISIIFLLCAILTLLFTLNAIKAHNFSDAGQCAIATAVLTILWRVFKKKSLK